MQVTLSYVLYSHKMVIKKNVILSLVLWYTVLRPFTPSPYLAPYIIFCRKSASICDNIRDTGLNICLLFYFRKRFFYELDVVYIFIYTGNQVALFLRLEVNFYMMNIKSKHIVFKGIFLITIMQIFSETQTRKSPWHKFNTNQDFYSQIHQLIIKNISDLTSNYLLLMSFIDLSEVTNKFQTVSLVKLSNLINISLQNYNCQAFHNLTEYWIINKKKPKIK